MNIRIGRDEVREPLYAVVPVFNPWRWKSRWKHTVRALKHFHDSGCVIYLIEAAYNRRELVFKDCGLHDALASCGIAGEHRHKYIGLRTVDELWLKENLINCAVGHLPSYWQQVCWLDSDVHFVRPNWVGEAIHKLQHFDFLQMFTHARDLGPNYELLPADYPHADGIGFAQGWKDEVLDAKLKGTAVDGSYPPRVWPGLAWAATRRAWEAVGGLLDVAIWGGGDFHMAWALINRPEKMMIPTLHHNYREIVEQLAWRCRTEIRQNVGVMPGTILHHWHGRKASRGYGAKHRLLAAERFDPLRHLKRDAQGLWQLHDDGSEAFVHIRDLFRHIAAERDEDSNDTRMDLTAQGH